MTGEARRVPLGARRAKRGYKPRLPAWPGRGTASSALGHGLPVLRQRHTGHMTRPSGVRELHGNTAPHADR